MKISQRTLDLLTRETFINGFFTQLAADGEDVSNARSDSETRNEIWQLARGASQFGIVTLGGTLVFARIHWDFGLECLDRMTGLRNIVQDPGLSESTKVEQLWQLRCAIFDALANT